MADILTTIQPVAVGTNTTIQNISFGATDWLEINNESPFSVSVAPQGISNSTFRLAPFERNAWPILQILGSSMLKVSIVSLVLTPGHYYTDPATETNAPMNLCIISKLSDQEAKTSVYPSYMQRMNTTVSTIANTLNNTGNPPATPVAFAEPNGDTSANGAWNVNNIGQETLGDALYNGSLAIVGVSGATISAFVTNLLASIRLINSGGNVEIDMQANAKSLVGGTSGTAFLYEPFNGLWKVIIVELANFKTAGANQQITLPTNFGYRAMIVATDSEAFELIAGGVAQGVRQWTSFGAAGAAGGTSATTAMQGFNLFWLASGFDTIQFNSGWASAHNGVILIIGQ